MVPQMQVRIVMRDRRAQAFRFMIKGLISGQTMFQSDAIPRTPTTPIAHANQLVGLLM
jgi:hypothetical protein